MSRNRKTTRRTQRTQRAILPSSGPPDSTQADRLRLRTLVRGIESASRPSKPYEVIGTRGEFDIIEDRRWHLRLIPDIPPEDAVVLSYLLDLPDERRRAIATLLTQAHLFVSRGGRIGRDPFRSLAAVPSTRTAPAHKQRNQRQLPVAL